MASKLRRPPLFWPGETSAGARRLAVFTQPPPPLPPKKALESKKTYKMECATSQRLPPTLTDVRAERSPAKSNLHVDFTDKSADVKEKREKFLTAKYGSHQMGLIRKRLAVEMWLYDELQKLFESPVGSTVKGPNGEIEVDIDELLDMDSDEERRRHLKNVLADAKKSPKDVQKFVDDLLERAKTL